MNVSILCHKLLSVAIGLSFTAYCRSVFCRSKESVQAEDGRVSAAVSQGSVQWTLKLHHRQVSAVVVYWSSSHRDVMRPSLSAPALTTDR